MAGTLVARTVPGAFEPAGQPGAAVATCVVCLRATSVVIHHAPKDAPQAPGARRFFLERPLCSWACAETAILHNNANKNLERRWERTAPILRAYARSVRGVARRPSDLAPRSPRSMPRDVGESGASTHMSPPASCRFS